jgi:uncharacterized protein DUF5681
MSENAGKMQVTGKFQRGQSGNPRGKIKGTKNKATLAAELLLKGEVENICRRLIQEALTGNIQAIKMVLERVLPPKKDCPVKIYLPSLQTSSDAVNAMSLISEAVSIGDISPNEGEALSRIVDIYVKAIVAHDYEKRLSHLEARR